MEVSPDPNYKKEKGKRKKEKGKRKKEKGKRKKEKGKRKKEKGKRVNIYLLKWGEKFKKLLNLGDFSAEFILLTGSIENAEKWNKLTQFIAEMVRDNAETGYETTPLYDELDLLSQSTLRTLQQMGVHFPPKYPPRIRFSV